jgi:hypothetical protein
MAPEGPGDLGELRVSGLGSEVFEGFLEGGVGAVAGVAPHLAVRLFGLLVSGGHQGAGVFFGERLPVEVEGPGETGFAGTLAAAVLVDDEAAQCWDAWRDPEGVVDGKEEFAGLVGGLVADSEIRRLRSREDIVGGVLRV